MNMVIENPIKDANALATPARAGTLFFLNLPARWHQAGRAAGLVVAVGALAMFGWACTSLPGASYTLDSSADAQLQAVLRANFMSSQAGLAQIIVEELNRGRGAATQFTTAHLSARGARCTEAPTRQCQFSARVVTTLSGLPEANRKNAKRETVIDISVNLVRTPQSVIVTKSERVLPP